MAWTSTSTTQWILGGQFMVEDMCIKFADAAAMPSDTIIFRTLHGWDPERKVVFTHNISNMGMGGSGELYWHDDNTLLVVNHGVEGGVPYVERTLSKLTDGTFQMSRASGDGEPLGPRFLTRVQESEAPSQARATTLPAVPGGRQSGAEC
jgi:hypothetical protein